MHEIGNFKRFGKISNFISGLKTKGLDFFLEEDFKSQLWNYQNPMVERGCAAFGISLGMPYLCKEFSDFAFQIPSKFKINDDVEKYILRKLGKRMGVPKEISERSKRGGGYFSFPTVMQRFEHTASKLLSDEYVKSHSYKKFFREKSFLLCFDILKHIFIDEVKIPKGFSVESLY